jgi:hypothetical protein
MRRFVVFGFLVLAAAFTLEARSVNPYTRKDGTRVSGYATGTNYSPASRDKSLYYGLIAAVVVPTFLCALWLMFRRDKKLRVPSGTAVNDRLKIINKKANELVALINTTGQLEPVNTTLLLTNGEVAFYDAPAVLHEAKSL